ncbi:MAG: hypothetical protein L3J75_03950 [Methylococcaceae bacterium]|nr:hypothetical protein [Methylococcaceae bacterium]
MELIIRSILAVPAIFVAWKIIYDITVGKRADLREEYKFAKEFLSDARKDDIHPFVLEKGYHAIAGSSILSPEYISYILSLKNPSQCLKDYVLSIQLMDELKMEGNLKLKFKRKYQCSWFRNWLKIFYSVGYFLLAFIALSPVVASNYFGISALHSLLLLAFTLPLAGTLAWSSLTAYARVKRGEELIYNQKKHTTIIMVPTYKRIQRTAYK